MQTKNQIIGLETILLTTMSRLSVCLDTNEKLKLFYYSAYFATILESHYTFWYYL